MVDSIWPANAILPSYNSALFLSPPIYELLTRRHLSLSLSLISSVSSSLLFRTHRFSPLFHQTLASQIQRDEMSLWQPYVDDHLMCVIEGTEGQKLKAAAIFGADGNPWATTTPFPEIKPEEFKAIMKDFNEPGTLAPTGLFIGGEKYMVIQGEPEVVIRGKKGAGGVCIKKTNQGVLFGIYDEPVTPGQCNLVVERLGDYLIENGL